MISKVNRDRANKLHNPVLNWKIRASWLDEAERVHNLSFPLASLIEFNYVSNITEDGTWSLWETMLTLDALQSIDTEECTMAPGTALIRANELVTAKIAAMIANGELTLSNGSYGAPKN